MIAALIPARGGSKRLQGKNLRLLAGQPLICHTVEAALSCPGLAEVWVSTDDEEIAEVARGAGARILMRPSELAQDSTPVSEVVRHFLDECQPEHVMLLQPTSPLRGREHIEEALRIYAARERTGCVVSVCPTKPLSWQGAIDDAGVFKYHVFPGEAERPNYLLNGALYLTSAERARQHGFVMAPIHPLVMPLQLSIDIDTLEDFYLTERALSSSS